MFPSPLTPCFNLKRRLFCENQPIFVGRLPIEFSILEIFNGRFLVKLQDKNHFHTPVIILLKSIRSDKIIPR